MAARGEECSISMMPNCNRVRDSDVIQLTLNPDASKAQNTFANTELLAQTRLETVCNAMQTTSGPSSRSRPLTF